jgi:anti-sigma regulatory factor (Ser/Thr protein kinase)
MATVEMTFTPLPAHVRTARLVATAVARRSGVPEALLDEVRLAVGEACSRAVEVHQEYCPGEPVRVALTGARERFEVVVTNSAAVGDDGMAWPPQPATGPDGLDPAMLPAQLGLAVIAGLADDVRVSRNGDGLSIRMSWPAGAPAG